MPSQISFVTWQENKPTNTLVKLLLLLVAASNYIRDTQKYHLISTAVMKGIIYFVLFFFPMKNYQLAFAQIFHSFGLVFEHNKGLQMK